MEHEFIKQYDKLTKKAYEYADILDVALAYFESIVDNPSKAESYAKTAINTINSRIEKTNQNEKN